MSNDSRIPIVSTSGIAGSDTWAEYPLCSHGRQNVSAKARDPFPLVLLEKTMAESVLMVLCVTLLTLGDNPLQILAELVQVSNHAVLRFIALLPVHFAVRFLGNQPPLRLVKSCHEGISFPAQ